MFANISRKGATILWVNPPLTVLFVQKSRNAWCWGVVHENEIESDLN